MSFKLNTNSTSHEVARKYLLANKILAEIKDARLLFIDLQLLNEQGVGPKGGGQAVQGYNELG